MSREIDRSEWGAICPAADTVDDRTVSVRPSVVDIEDDGSTLVSVYMQEDGIDVRVNALQVVVRGKHIVVMQEHPPYPIERWMLLWEGDLS